MVVGEDVPHRVLRGVREGVGVGGGAVPRGLRRDRRFEHLAGVEEFAPLLLGRHGRGVRDDEPERPGLTYVPEPWRSSTTPADSRERSASRTVGVVTPQSSASCRTEGAARPR